MTPRFVTRAVLALLAVVGCAAPAPAPSSTGPSPASPAPTQSGVVSSPASPPLTPTPTPLPTPTPITTITTETDLGTVTLEIPAPLIPPGIQIAVLLRPPEEAPRVLRDAGVRQPFHLLEPESTSFAEPIRVTLTMDTDRVTRADGSIAITYLAIRAPEGDWQWLDEARMTVARQVTQVSGTTMHLGSLWAWSDRADLVVSRGLPSRLIGQAVRPLVAITSQDRREHPVAFTQAPDYFSMVPTVVEVGPPIAGSLTRDLRCLAEGDYTVRLTGHPTNFGADNPFFTGTLGLPPTTGTLSYDLTGSCVEAPSATPSPNATPNSSPTSSP